MCTISEFFNFIPYLEKKIGVTKADREATEIIAGLHETVQKLQHQNATLVSKNNELNEALDKKKKELLLAKRSASGTLKRATAAALNSSSNHKVPDVEIVPGPNPRSSAALVVEPSADGNYMEIARKLKAR